MYRAAEMAMDFPFCVDNSSQPDEIKVAIHNLKRSIRYGKLAEHALQQLQTIGHYDGRVPCVQTKLIYDKSGIVSHRFPKLEAIHRGLIPGYQDFQIRLSDKKEHYKRASYDVLFSGYYTKYDEDTKKIVVAHTDDDHSHSGHIGRVHVCSNHISFHASSIRQDTGKIFHNCNLPGADDAMMLFARAVAAMVFMDMRWSTDNYPQQIVDLYKNLPRWLVDDGFCRRWFREIRDHVAVASVMET